MIKDAADTLDPRSFERLATYIRDVSGIKITASKKGMLEGRLRRRVRRLGLESLARYCVYLFDEGGLAQEETALIDAVTTNKTDFFREPHHFQYLLHELLPAFACSDAGRPYRVWSAGCSTGAEPYTVAMVCDWFRRNREDLRFDILATDICTEVLAEAVRAVYPHDMILPAPMEMRRRALLKSRDPRRALVRIAPEVRSMVRFDRLNLMERRYPVNEPMDLIMCRNLLIYFDRPTQQEVLARLCRHLRPGGCMMLGHSESVAGYDLPLRPIGATIFIKEA